MLADIGGEYRSTSPNLCSDLCHALMPELRDEHGNASNASEAEPCVRYNI